ncbi:MAG TPA: ribosome maturation factor RimM [Woeseiaceae bacterium]|nr:ribosome maturation factor RimM [Woeseiaceae bacterium]
MAAATTPGGKRRDPVVLGRITGLYGVRGWVRVRSYTEPPAALLGYDEWLVGGPGTWERFEVTGGREHGKGLVAQLAGTADRDAAARFLGADVAVERERMPEPAEGEYYWADLEGLEVRHRGGRLLGRVDRLLETGAHDVLVVSREEDGQKREVLVPFVPGTFVLDVNLAAGVIDVDWEWD